jgi:hypothetical protein
MKHRLLQFPKIIDKRGNLSFLENKKQVPFEINRVFWTYDVPGGEYRGGHAYRNQQEIIIALSGSFDVVITLKNGEKEIVSLNRSYNGLFIPPMMWRHIENFSTNALALHLSSMVFDENDYLRDINEYFR